MSSAPTVITKGLLAGAKNWESGPRLPDETTTLMPSFQSSSMALLSAFVSRWLGTTSESERLTTRMLWVAWLT